MRFAYIQNISLFDLEMTSVSSYNEGYTAMCFIMPRLIVAYEGVLVFEILHHFFKINLGSKSTFFCDEFGQRKVNA